MRDVTDIQPRAANSSSRRSKQSTLDLRGKDDSNPRSRHVIDLNQGRRQRQSLFERLRHDNFYEAIPLTTFGARSDLMAKEARQDQDATDDPRPDWSDRLESWDNSLKRRNASWQRHARSWARQGLFGVTVAVDAMAARIPWLATRKRKRAALTILLMVFLAAATYGATKLIADSKGIPAGPHTPASTAITDSINKAIGGIGGNAGSGKANINGSVSGASFMSRTVPISAPTAATPGSGAASGVTGSVTGTMPGGGSAGGGGIINTGPGSTGTIGGGSGLPTGGGGTTTPVAPPPAVITPPPIINPPPTPCLTCALPINPPSPTSVLPNTSILPKTNLLHLAYP
jgi:hypothetical protein